MAMRGRGRGGWRGGRAGGRGGLGPPGLKDDDGNIVNIDANAGPPPLFPAIELHHDPPETTAHDRLLLLRRADLLRYYKASPYYIDSQEDRAAKQSAAAAGSSIDEVEKYSDRFNKKVTKQASKPPLASLLTFHPHHFPEELFSDRDKRLAARAARSGDLFRRNPEDGALSKRLDSLYKAEEKGGPGGAGTPVGDRAGRGGPGEGGGADAGDDDDVAGAYDEDDDDVMEEDDYYQGEYFDDDEGYDDGYDEGGDEGAIY